MITTVFFNWLNTVFNYVFNLIHMPSVPDWVDSFTGTLFSYVTQCTQFVSWLFPSQAVFNMFLAFQLDCITCVITYKLLHWIFHTKYELHA